MEELILASIENDRGVDKNKSLIHNNRWGVYFIEKISLIKGGYSV